MPGGVGRVSERVMRDATREDRAIAPVRNANEIFFNLDSRRVYFDSRQGLLYFVDEPRNLVCATISSILGEAVASALIEQLHLDTHRFFNGARRARLAAGQADAVLVALRIAGVRVTIR